MTRSAGADAGAGGTSGKAAAVYGLQGKRELRSYIGDMRQLAGVQRMELAQGKGKGNEIIQVRNGSGLQFQINVSRGFDLGLCELHGIPLSWISQTGPVSPYAYDKEGTEWNRGFEGGLMATCGLTTMGRPSVDEGRAFGQHGRISYTPAEVVQAEAYWEEDRYKLLCRGVMREGIVNGENIALERTIRTELGENRIWISDTVTNEAFVPVEHLMLHHFNFGFPLVGPACRIKIPSRERRWLAGSGAADSFGTFDEPEAGAVPTVMVHSRLETDRDGVTEVSVSSPVLHNGAERELAVALRYDAEASPFLTQWKHTGQGIYVLGIEPCNATTEGRAVHRERGTMPYLQPGESKTYTLSLQFRLD